MRLDLALASLRQAVESHPKISQLVLEIEGRLETLHAIVQGPSPEEALVASTALTLLTYDVQRARRKSAAPPHDFEPHYPECSKDGPRA